MSTAYYSMKVLLILQLTAINEQSIARVAKDCQSLLNPYDVPLFSFNDFDDYLEGQNVSSQLVNLYTEIKEGLRSPYKWYNGFLKKYNYKDFL